MAVFSSIAESSLARVRGVGEWTEFAGRSVKGTLGTPRYFSEVLRQAAILVRGTSGVMFLINGFMGMTIAAVGYFILRAIGAADYIGLISGYGIPHQTGTTVFGYVFAAKVCCGMAAELGAMKIQQEVDALEMTGVDSMRYVVGTRIAATLIYVPIGCAIALFAQTAGAYFGATFILNGVSGTTLLDVSWGMQNPQVEFIALIICFAIGISCAITACFFGLRATGGPAGVGTVVAQSLLVNLVLVHVLAGGLAVVFYGNDINLPIGG